MEDLTSTTSTKGMVAQEVEGVLINQDVEFLLDKPEAEGGKPLEFDSREEAIQYLFRHGYEATDIEFMYWVPTVPEGEVMVDYWLNTGEKVEP